MLRTTSRASRNSRIVGLSAGDLIHERDGVHGVGRDDQEHCASMLQVLEHQDQGGESRVLLCVELSYLQREWHTGRMSIREEGYN